MGKKNYMRPFMSMEAFTPNSYCAECGDEEGYVLVAYCADSKHKLEIKVGSEQGRWYAIADGSGLQGTLELDQNDPTMTNWLFMGTINKDHIIDGVDYSRGEFVGLDETGISQNKKAGDIVWDGQPQVYCNHQGLAKGQTHHHLIKDTIYKLMS